MNFNNKKILVKLFIQFFKTIHKSPCLKHTMLDGVITWYVSKIQATVLLKQSSCSERKDFSANWHQGLKSTQHFWSACKIPLAHPVGKWYSHSSVKQSAQIRSPNCHCSLLHILIWRNSPSTHIRVRHWWRILHIDSRHMFPFYSRFLDFVRFASWLHLKENKTVLVKAPYIYFTLYFAIIWYVVGKKCIETECY